MRLVVLVYFLMHVAPILFILYKYLSFLLVPQPPYPHPPPLPPTFNQPSTRTLSQLGAQLSGSISSLFTKFIGKFPAEASPPKHATVPLSFVKQFMLLKRVSVWCASSRLEFQNPRLEASRQLAARDQIEVLVGKQPLQLVDGHNGSLVERAFSSSFSFGPTPFGLAERLKLGPPALEMQPLAGHLWFREIITAATRGRLGGADLPLPRA